MCPADGDVREQKHITLPESDFYGWPD